MKDTKIRVPRHLCAIAIAGTSPFSDEHKRHDLHPERVASSDMNVRTTVRNLQIQAMPAVSKTRQHAVLVSSSCQMSQRSKKNTIKQYISKPSEASRRPDRYKIGLRDVLSPTVDAII